MLVVVCVIALVWNGITAVAVALAIDAGGSDGWFDTAPDSVLLGRSVAHPACLPPAIRCGLRDAGVG